jgi:CHAT domain-containing protein/tetratricopeptide (TPR) repeat protein
MAVTRNAVGNSPVRRRAVVISRSALTVCAALLVVVIGLAAYLLRPRGSNVERGTVALIDAFSKRRFIEPRLSGGFKHGEFRPPRDEASDIKTTELDRARDLITDAVAMGEASAQLAYARLLLSEDRKLPDALKYLRKVLAASPESAEAHNDLGVCLIQTGKLEDAIDEFHTALKLKTDLPEALFNRGLCYQRLLLKEPARADFNRASEIERDGRWLDEIKRRVDELSRPPAPQNPAADLIAEFDAALIDGRIDEARRIADQHSELVTRHAIWEVTIEQLQATVRGDLAKAERALFEIELIGDVSIETRGDSLIADLAGYISNIPNSERQTELDLIRDYVQTRRRVELENDKKAAFERLEKQFRDRGNYVFEALSAFQVADYFYAVKRFGDSREKIKKILSRAESREWPHTRARFLSELALDTSLLGQDSLAIRYFEQAKSLCRKSPDLESKLLQYMSVPYLQLGDFDAALACLRDSTKLCPENILQSAVLANLAHNYSQIANIYSLRNKHALALLYGEQALSYSELANDMNYAAEYSSFTAVAHVRLNQMKEADANLKRAFDYLGKIEAGRPRDYTEANVLINAGEVAARRGDAPRALQCYEKAEALIALDEGHILPTINILRDRARVYATSGQTEKAHSGLMRAITLIERNRANIKTIDQRILFLAASRGTFDELISLDVSAGGYGSEAFDMSEGCRARALLEEVTPEGKASERRGLNTRSFTQTSGQSAQVKPLRLADVQSQLPEDLTMLEYVVTDHRTYLFLVRRSGFKVFESSANTEVLDRLVHDYVSDLQQIAPLDEVNEKARVLYDYLIKPVEAEIGDDSNLCIVPDEALHSLPFAALRDRSNKYFIEAHRLTYAPSASVLVRCIKEHRAKSDKNPEKMLAVGDPEFNRDSFSSLQSLPEAEKEATESERFYAPGSIVLKREKATETSVVAAMKGCDVIHLALHCVVEDGSPELAALVLAGATSRKNLLRPGSAPVDDARSHTASSGAAERSAALSKALREESVIDPNDGLLFLKELYGIRLPRTKLVVLSACQSGLGQYYRGEGMVSLIRPFLTSGVPTVVASLWPVNSQATADLMIDFHKQRTQARMRAGDAIRAAQIDMTRSTLFQHPYYWAPFILVGANE